MVTRKDGYSSPAACQDALPCEAFGWISEGSYSISTLHHWLKLLMVWSEHGKNCKTEISRCAHWSGQPWYTPVRLLGNISTLSRCRMDYLKDTFSSEWVIFIRTIDLQAFIKPVSLRWWGISSRDHPPLFAQTVNLLGRVRVMHVSIIWWR